MPPLSERSKNSMAPANGNGKRSIDVVDMTGSDDELYPRANKSQRSATQRTAQQAQQSRIPPIGSAHSGCENVYAAPSSSSTRLLAESHPESERTAWLADDTDVNEILDSSQDNADGSENLQLYGTLSTKITGVRYYRGYANRGEQILMRREPGNPYDHNAIRIDNVAATQIGHIPRTTAAKLAKYLDNRWLHMEGMLAGEIGQFDCPLTVHMYGPDPGSDTGMRLKERMAQDRLPLQALNDAERTRKKEEKERLAAARCVAAAAAKGKKKYTNQAGCGGDGQPELSTILDDAARINPREISEATDKLGRLEDELKDMPLALQPHAISTKMMPYQLQGLQWLLDQENPTAPNTESSESVQLWTKSKNNRFTNLATNYSTQTAPALASGGILADDMGLGKTLQMIALVVADGEKFGKAGPTLIVAPVSVMSNWTGQISSHVKESSKLEVYTYHAAGRTKMGPTDFKKYDVVLTSYQTLASDYMPSGKSSKQPDKKLRSSGLYSVKWRRVILDEAHSVRNPKAKGTLAVTAVMARSRWALTGTPIVNTTKDLYSLLRFVGISGGLEQLDIFNRVLTRPLMLDDSSASALLQLIMRNFTLRRRKDMAYIDLKLPKLEEFLHRIEFSDAERKRYDALAAEAKGLLSKYRQQPTGSGQRNDNAYNHLLEILLRMRQCCNHWKLCEERVTKLLSQLENQKTVDLTAENRRALQDILQVQIESQEDCAICLEPLHSPAITSCGHSFGHDCISRVIEIQHKCPMCRAELNDDTVLVFPVKEGEDEAGKDDVDGAQSTKVTAMMKILAAIKGNKVKSGAEKTIVFSQWTKFLDIVEKELECEGYKFCRLDGTMSAAKRDQSLRALEHDDSTTILLGSLGVAAVGLNLSFCNNVILADTWWAPAIEDQAVDRVHRLGQKRETRVFRVVMDNSIELGTLQVQQQKRKLMNLAFSEKSSKRDKAREGRLADIELLLK